MLEDLDFSFNPGDDDKSGMNCRNLSDPWSDADIVEVSDTTRGMWPVIRVSASD